MLVLLIGAWHVWSYAPFISDDALISLRYSERLLAGDGLTWTDGERVEGYTDLAWVLLTALFGALRVDLIVAARALCLAGTTALVCITALTPDRPTRLSLPRIFSGSLMLVLSGPMAVWAIGGLEHGFQVGVVAAAAWLLMRADPPRRERWALNVLLVLLILLRADGVVLVGGLLLGSLLHRPSWRPVRAAIAPALAMALQLVFRKLYYDAWVPNTALVKVSFSLARVQLGLQHIQTWALFGSMLLVAVGLAVIGQWGRSRRWLVPFTASVGWVAYLVTVGGDIFPAWRQLWLGLAPLGLVIAEGAESWWERTQNSWRIRAVLMVGWVSLIGMYGQAQLSDPQNKRGREERWEFDGYSLGPFLKEAWGSRKPLLAVDAAGALPYFSQLPSLDLLGLNDRYIATHPPQLGSAIATGHEFGDGAYVWRRKPDILSMCGAAGARDPCFLSGRQFFAHPEFHNFYQLVRYHSQHFKDQRGDLWVRREDGVLGIVREEDKVVIPGWLLAQASGVAELHQGLLKARVTPMEPAHLERLRLPAGRWRMTADSDTPVYLGALCEGRSMARKSDDMVIDVKTDSRLDVLVSAAAPAFVERLTFERTANDSQMTCTDTRDPEIHVEQLNVRVPQGASYLQPHGFKLSRQHPNVRIRFGVEHAERYELSVDGNDVYHLRFMAGERLVSERQLAPRSGGLAPFSIEVKPEVDSVEVNMAGGDGLGSVGYFVPEGS